MNDDGEATATAATAADDFDMHKYTHDNDSMRTALQTHTPLR